MRTRIGRSLPMVGEGGDGLPVSTNSRRESRVESACSVLVVVPVASDIVGGW